MRDDGILMTRLDAIRDIRCGRGIQLTFVGRFTTFRVIMRRSPIKGGSPQAVYDCTQKGQTYYINITAKQVLSFIRRHYPRNIWGVVVNEDPFGKVHPSYTEHRAA